MSQVSRKGFVDKNGNQVNIVPNVPGATAGNLASFDAEGNLQDSGKAIDQSPTANSANLVTSGGVKAALDNAANKVDALIRSIGNTSIDEMPIIKIGAGAVSEGVSTGAVRDYAHAEGVCTVAAGTGSHAEGDGGGDDKEAIDVTKLWVVRNPNIGGEIDYCKIVVDCAQGYTPDMFVSAGDVILYKDVSTFEDKYASVRAVGGLPGTEDFYLQLSSPIQVNITSNSRSKTLYKIPSGALGRASHVEGLGTIAKADYQHVQGKYNVADANGDYAYIIGNGTADDARSNAFAIKWDGTIVVWNNGTPVELSPANLAALIAQLTLTQS